MSREVDSGLPKASDPKGEDAGTSTARTIWTCAHGCMTLVFAYAASVQLNDPDWLLWFGGYALVAVACIALALQSNQSSLPTLLPEQANPNLVARYAAILSVVGLGLNVWNEKRISFSVHNEVGRETLGLIMVLCWMVISAVFSPQHDLKGEKTTSVATASALLLLTIVTLVSLWAIPEFLIQEEGQFEL
mmetsp:Transcript_30973/g.45938  ORF Transcript_30973/g.45938 Transcript_30973/m.45938 type:complete len:190 (-) Transcript_30973:213-782(-)|eukprot:CAMPEP_0194048740 /NCGR_PEP_ID=MMETSP0009_2-20130614/28335_1 /TAXON_ID=210454 /ORGANISM="Grammatophora oceanica, Strain CCMP 410" /LENGTH=189 /DNA_ID=CAMNT_0038694697 /DNA_START=70 /DNA_END=639 /DNA_ORIENTATION=+